VNTYTTLKTKYPCCKGRARFKAVHDVPTQIYDRRCPFCGKAWMVTRTSLAPISYGRVDELVWEEVGVDKRF
jgi:hypothetical protein